MLEKKLEKLESLCKLKEMGHVSSTANLDALRDSRVSRHLYAGSYAGDSRT